MNSVLNSLLYKEVNIDISYYYCAKCKIKTHIPIICSCGATPIKKELFYCGVLTKVTDLGLFFMDKYKKQYYYKIEYIENIQEI